MDRNIRDGSVIDNGNTEVSAPLHVRRLKGNARCFRCKEADTPCYLERPGLHCLTCASAEQCVFQRLVLREGAASTFTWEELISEDASTFATPAPPSSQLTSRKRPYHSFVNDQQHFARVITPPPPSYFPEPGSAVYQQDFPETDLYETGAWFEEAVVEPLPFQHGFFGQYAVGVEPPDKRRDHVIHDLYLASDQFPSLEQRGRQWTSTSDTLSNPSLIPDTFPSQVAAIEYTRKSGDELTSVPSRGVFVCEECGKKFNLKSLLSKHMARHIKSFYCEHPGCPRREGFATKNDLDRHIASVHDTSHVPTAYVCSVAGCRDPGKIWPRKDNFKAHVKRMHPEENVEEVMKASLIEPDPGPEPIHLSDSEGEEPVSNLPRPTVPMFPLSAPPTDMMKSTPGYPIHDKQPSGANITKKGSICSSLSSNHSASRVEVG